MNVIRWGLHSFFAVAIAGAGMALEALLWVTVLTWVVVEALVIAVSDDNARLDIHDRRPRADHGDAGGDRL